MVAWSHAQAKHEEAVHGWSYIELLQKSDIRAVDVACHVATAQGADQWPLSVFVPRRMLRIPSHILSARNRILADVPHACLHRRKWSVTTAPQTHTGKPSLTHILVNTFRAFYPGDSLP
jgi:hypothetical protein